MTNLNIEIPTGKYVVAVSGGVDSMVLLDILAKQEDLNLVIAHFDHGIRPDSAKDETLVAKVAKRHGLVFTSKKVALGSNASEALARDARYRFLKTVVKDNHAKALITAHHQNDQIETAVFNLLRGTGRKGLGSLQSTELVLRPLISISKDQIYDYAKEQGIEWREDSTNLDTKYKRNYIRHKVLPKLTNVERQQLIASINQTVRTNQLIDNDLANYISQNSNSKTTLNRRAFTALPHRVALEVMAAWLRQNEVRDFTSKLLDRLTIAAKTLQPGQQTDINLTYVLQINKANLALKAREC